MSAAKVWPLVSAKVVSAGGRSRARTRKAAIWPRVTGWSGQKRSGPQPRVMPAAVSWAISPANTWPTLSENVSMDAPVVRFFCSGCAFGCFAGGTCPVFFGFDCASLSTAGHHEGRSEVRNTESAVFQ